MSIAFAFTTAKLEINVGACSPYGANCARLLEMQKAILSPTKHLDYLDGMRAVAAIYVVLSHASLYIPYLNPSQPSPMIIEALKRLLGYGHYAVTIFIILSGYCLMLPVTKRGELPGGAVSFFKRRAIRILPPYFLALSISLLLIATLVGKKTGSVWDVSIPVTTFDIVSHLLLLQDVLASTAQKINHSLWSISVEWRIYFLFPTMLVLWKKWGPYAVVSSSLILAYIVQYCLVFTPLNSQYWGICAHYVGLFTIGMLACEISFSQNTRFSYRDKFPWSKAAFVMFVTILVVVAKTNLPFYVCDFLISIWAFLILISLSTQKEGLVFRFLSLPPVVFIGTFAYSIYLIHAPFLPLITHYMGLLRLSPLISGLSILFFGLTFSVGIAYLFYLCCEKPFIRKKSLVTPSS